MICVERGGGPEIGAFRAKPRKCAFHRRFYPLARPYILLMGAIEWDRWGAEVAVGHGLVETRRGSRPAEIRLSAPVRVCGQRVFSLARVRYGERARSSRSLHLDRQIRGPRCGRF